MLFRKELRPPGKPIVRMLLEVVLQPAAAFVKPFRHLIH